ncbi:hypothetical protein X768_06200 [Mesorhizobium sp. LSJC265A00]|nr:hypothetical protein X768_06200 [Mesorhizobium sp. LSJC265A00]
MSASPRGDKATWPKPNSPSFAMKASVSPKDAKGTFNAAPTETRIALRYSGSQQVASTKTASAPKAAALRKIDPILSWLAMPMRTTINASAGKVSSKASAGCGVPLLPIANIPRCMWKPAILSMTALAAT